MIEGLRPCTTIKDSGVPWLGDIREHREIRCVKRLSLERNASGTTRRFNVIGAFNDGASLYPPAAGSSRAWA